MTASSRERPIGRTAGPDDIDAVTRTVALAFADDPVWGPALGGGRTSTADRARIWRILVAAAVRYPWTSIVGDGEAVSVWIPPDGIELDEAGFAALRIALIDLLGPDAAADFVALTDRFETNHRHEEPHAYLSLLATHPEARGRGLGMTLLAEDLARLDALHVPAWLESTNPVNDRRYAAVGFERVGSFRAIDEAHVITTMWRPAR